MTSECVRTDSILPPGAGLEQGRCKQSIFSLSIFGILVDGLASSVVIFAPILLRFFIVFAYARAKIPCYRFFNFDQAAKKVMLHQIRRGRVKQRFLDVFRPHLGFQSEM